MVSTIIIWGIIFFTTYFYGRMLKYAILGTKESNQIKSTSYILLSLAGTVFLSMILSIWSFFLPVNHIANICLLIPPVFYSILKIVKINLFFTKFKAFISNKNLFIILLFFSVSILFLSLIHPTDYDVGLYHAQSIQWVEKYPVVRGLGLIHHRLAFNSSLYLPSAFFSFSFYKGEPFHLYNSYLLLLFVIYSVIQIFNSFKSFLSLLYLLILCFIILNTYKMVSSPIPHVTIFILIGFLLLLIIKKNDEKELLIRDFQQFLIIILPVYVFTVRYSEAFIVLISFVYLIYIWKTLKSKHLIKIYLFIALLLTPWLIKNILLSGYLIFPFLSIDFFHLPWCIPIEDVVFYKNVIRYFPLCHSCDPMVLSQIDFIKWFPAWIIQLEIINKISLFVVAVFPIFYVLYSIFIKNSFYKNSFIVFVAFIGFFSVICNIIIVPDFRFSNYFIMIECIAFIYLFGTHYNFLNSVYIKYLNYAICYILSILFICNIIYHITGLKSLYDKYLIYPAPYQKVLTKAIMVNNIVVNVPIEGDQCWNSCVPCSFLTKYGLYRDIELRGKMIKNGFILKKLTK